MAKDPAFLFYPSDFMIGTALFSQEQRGKYVTLLCYQHQLGHLSKEDMLSVCGKEDEKIFGKFNVDTFGLYFNKRLEDEKNKRQIFTQSRLNNLKSHKKPHMGSHMENENEDVIKDVKKDRIVKERKVFTPPTIEEVTAYGIERKSKVIPEGFIDFYASKGWMVGKNPMKDWKAAFRNAEGWDKWDKKQKSEQSDNDNRDMWEKKANKNCTNCRGTGAVYAPGSGNFAKCGCVK